MRHEVGRTRDLVCLVVDELSHVLRSAETVDTNRPRTQRGHGRSAWQLRRVRPLDTDVDVELVVGRPGVLRQLAGPVRVNRPWQLSLPYSAARAWKDALGVPSSYLG